MKVSPEIVFKQKYNAFQHVSSSPILKEMNIIQTDIELLLIANAITDKYGTFDVRELISYSGMSTSSIRNWREKMWSNGFILDAFKDKSFLYRLSTKSKLIIEKYIIFLSSSN